MSDTMRRTAEADERQADDAEYNETEGKATAAMWSGVAAGVGEAGAGAFSILGARAGGSTPVDAAGNSADATADATAAAKAAANAAAQAQSQAKQLVALGQITDAAGKLVSAGLNGQSLMDGADAEKAKEAADHAKDVAEDASGFQKDEHDAIDKAITFASDYDNTQNQATQAALHRA